MMMLLPSMTTTQLDLMWDALIRGDGKDREGNRYDLTPSDLPHLTWTLASELRRHVAFQAEQIATLAAENTALRRRLVEAGAVDPGEGWARDE